MILNNSTIQIFRNVDGNKVELEVKYEGDKVTTFVVHRINSLHIGFEFSKWCLFLSGNFLVNNWIFTFIFGLLLVLKYIHFVTSVNKDILLVMEFVGVQIVNKRLFFGLDTTEFLPWNTIQDVFINEVIKEKRVLYYLTFIVKDLNRDKNAVRLVPLFREIKPERKCLEYIYNHIAVFIKSGKNS